MKTNMPTPERTEENMTYRGVRLRLYRSAIDGLNVYIVTSDIVPPSTDSGYVWRWSNSINEAWRIAISNVESRLLRLRRFNLEA